MAKSILLTGSYPSRAELNTVTKEQRHEWIKWQIAELGATFPGATVLEQDGAMLHAMVQDFKDLDALFVGR